MDCDLQDDPVYFEALYKKALAGWDIVLAKRINRVDNWFKKIFSKFFIKYLDILLIQHKIVQLQILEFTTKR